MRQTWSQFLASRYAASLAYETTAAIILLLLCTSIRIGEGFEYTIIWGLCFCSSVCKWKQRNFWQCICFSRRERAQFPVVGMWEGAATPLAPSARLLSTVHALSPPATRRLPVLESSAALAVSKFPPRQARRSARRSFASVKAFQNETRRADVLTAFGGMASIQVSYILKMEVKNPSQTLKHTTLCHVTDDENVHSSANLPVPVSTRNSLRTVRTMVLYENRS
jgi:hypothetical protein